MTRRSMASDTETSRDAFFAEELETLTRRNAQAINDRAARKNSAEGRLTAVLACMDERNTLTEEALGLHPSEVRRIATAGGKIAAPDLLNLLGLEKTAGEGVTLHLVTHEVIGRPDLGCAAFKNDIAAQETFFRGLKDGLASALPSASIHVTSMDTSTGALRAISVDDNDGQFAGFARQGGRPETRCSDEAHAGYGIYVGEAYRAWNLKRNVYFHITASAPSLAGDLDIALAVILHHSTVDLSDKPIVLHVDTPESWDGFPEGASERMDAVVHAFLAKPEVAPMAADGSLRVVRTVTDTDTWRGRLAER